MTKLTTEEFIQRARTVHGEKYDYSKVQYVDRKRKINIICPKHGEYAQLPSIHLQGSGCPECGKERTSLLMSPKAFIIKAKAIHGDKYDYSKVEYDGSKAKVCIICKEHGEFWQEARTHLSGCGCPICTGRKKMRTSDFIKKARLVHGNKYDYSKAVYNGNKERLCIICPEHGEFWQQASSHLKGTGCPKCGIIKSSSAQKIWTREKCYETALQYQDLSTFSQECQVAYVIAHRNSWLKDYTWLKRKKVPNGYWNKSLVLEEAKKYNTYGAFEKGSPSAFFAAKNHGWIKECSWFIKPKNAKRWNYDTCYEEALKYKSRQEFRLESITAYTLARKQGWLGEYVWLTRFINMSYDYCKQEAQKYTYFNDFRSKSRLVYLTAKREKWLKDYSWLIKEPFEPHNKKWNYDTCFAEAKKYKTRSAFDKSGGGAYDVARRNGWITDYFWMPDLTMSEAKVDSVYCYVFEDQRAAYVGRTLMYRQHIRDIEHNNDEKDVVYKFAKKNKCNIPKMQIIESNLTIQQGREREDFWRRHYEAHGFLMLNRAATGSKSGSLGALGRGKWTFDKAYKIAQAFHTVTEMCEEYEYLYKISKAKGWLEKFDWFRGKEIRIEKQTKWTEEVCREEALKYKSRKDFRRMCKGAYEKAKEMGWIENYTWLSYPKPRPAWDYESCKVEASKYTNRNEFGKHSYGAYNYSRKQGWLDEFYPTPLRRFLDYETCKKLASNYNNKSELLANDRSLYETLKKKGWLKDFFPS